jgi:hypothetical protein
MMAKFTKSIGSPNKKNQRNFSAYNLNLFTRKSISKKSADFFEEIKKPLVISPLLSFRSADLRRKFMGLNAKRRISCDLLNINLHNLNKLNNPELTLSGKTQTSNLIKSDLNCLRNRTISNVSTIIDEHEKTYRVEETKKNYYGNFVEKETVSFYVDNIIDIEIPNKFHLFNLIFDVMTMLLKNRNDKKVFDVRFDILLLNDYCEYLDNANLKRIKNKIKIVSYIRDWPDIGKKFVPSKKLTLPFENLILLNVDFSSLIKEVKPTKAMSIHINQIMGLLGEELTTVFKPLKKLDYFYVNEIEEKFFLYNKFPFEFLDEIGVKIVNLSPKERNNHLWDTRIKKLDYL